MSNESIEYVVGIVAVNVDIYAKSSIPLKEKYDPNKINTSVGGVARNILCNLSLLGINTKFLTTLGDDIYGNYIIDYKKNKIDINHILKITNESSNVFLQILNNKNDMHMAFCDMTINKNINLEYLKFNENILEILKQ